MLNTIDVTILKGRAAGHYDMGCSGVAAAFAAGKTHGTPCCGPWKAVGGFACGAHLPGTGLKSTDEAQCAHRAQRSSWCSGPVRLGYEGLLEPSTGLNPVVAVRADGLMAVCGKDV